MPAFHQNFKFSREVNFQTKMMKITGFPFSTEFERSFHRNHGLHPYFIAKHANAAKTTNGCCSTFQKSSKWGSCLNLSSIPTKAEELHVKVDEKSRTLTVSGKSETESNRRDGLLSFLSIKTYQS